MHFSHAMALLISCPFPVAGAVRYALATTGAGSGRKKPQLTKKYFLVSVQKVVVARSKKIG
jgi:hypothetical protein